MAGERQLWDAAGADSERDKPGFGAGSIRPTFRDSVFAGGCILREDRSIPGTLPLGDPAHRSRQAAKCEESEARFSAALSVR